MRKNSLLFVALVLSPFLAFSSVKNDANILEQKSPPKPPEIGGINNSRKDYPASISLSFDGDEIVAGGTVKNIKIEGKPEKVEGRYGDGLKVSENDFIELLVDNRNELKNGTISLWVKPLSWEADNFFHVFAEISGDGRFLLYKYYEDNWMFFLSDPQNIKRTYKAGKKNVFKRNTWVHIAAKWSKNLIQLYINGRPVSKSPSIMIPPGKLNGRLLIGDRDFGSGGKRETVIDEVKIYYSPLSDESILELYEKNFLSRKDNAMDDLSVDISYNNKNEKFKLNIAADWFFNNDIDDISVHVNQKEIAVIKVERGKNEYEIEINGSELNRDENDLSISCDGALCFSKNIASVDKSYNRQNIDSRLLIQKAGEELKAVINDIDLIFNNKGMLKNINYNNDELIVSASRFFLRNNAGKKDCRLLDSHINSKYWQGEFDCVDDGVSDLLVSLEVDSFRGVLYSIQRSPSVDSVEGELLFEIELENDFIEAEHFWDKTGFDNTKAISSDEIVEHKFLPYWWLGGKRASLFWFSESIEGWGVEENEKILKLLREPNGNILQIKLADIEPNSPKNINVEFGIYPSYKKSEYKLQRKINIYPSKNENLRIIWPRYNEHSVKYIGLFDPINSIWMSRYAREKKVKREEVAPYFCPTFISTLHPIWPLVENDFRGILDSTSVDVRLFGGAFALIDPANRLWQKLFLENLDTAIDKYNFKFIYFDNIMTYPNFYNRNEEENYKYKEYFPHKDYVGFYSLINEDLRSKDVISIAHMSGNMNSVYMNFFDVIVSGEQFRGKVKDDYLDVYTLDEFRAEFDPIYRGKPVIFLPQFSEEFKNDVGAARRLIALLLIHDIGIWPSWINIEVVGEVVSRLKEFEYEEADFKPYYENNDLYKLKSQNLKMSAYEKDNNYLFIISNLGKTRESASACVNENMSSSIKWVIKDDLKFSIKENCVSGVVEAGDFKIIELRLGNN